MTGHDSHDTPHGSDAHHGSVGLYLGVFVCLAGLTAASFGVANSPIMDTPSIGWACMMAISCAKALLVVMFFMHLKWEANWKYVLTVPASIMSMFLLLMLVPDIGYRTRRYTEVRKEHAAQPVAEVLAETKSNTGGEGPGSP